jgi:hypothetical protein
MSDEQHEQVHDQGTEKLSGDEVANAAAESLHGAKAEEEKYDQPDAVVLPGGGTLIADTTERDDGTAGRGSASSRK